MKPKLYQSILVSNVFDPITHNAETLLDLYQKLDKQKRYCSIETRITNDKQLINDFNYLIDKNKWTVTGWATGDISRADLNPSSLSEELRLSTEDKLTEMMELAIENKMTYFGIASGKIEDPNRHDKSILQFQKSLTTLLQRANGRIRIIVEPLDEFAHKKNVIGTTNTIIKCFDIFSKEIENESLSICWDSAHFALNNEDFDESIKALAPMISRIHFSNAILDPNTDGYGDYHMMFEEPGFITPAISSNILKSIIKYSNRNILLVSNEIRASQSDNLWELEEFCYNWINSAISVVTE